MNLLLDAPSWTRLLLVSLLIAAAVQDVVQRRISNWISLLVITAAAVAAVMIGPTVALWQNGLIFVLLMGIGTLLFSAGWLGGGDVKLIAAVGLWASFASILILLAFVLMAGGVLAAISLVARGGRAARRAKGVPYGVAIAIGAIIVLFQPNLLGVSSSDSPLDLQAARQRAAITTLAPGRSVPPQFLPSN
ncbi:MAG: prepilin peptidase [Pseudomonadota bacterium]|nr:prepilin peptidase [Pseudomonadota bacterium]